MNEEKAKRLIEISKRTIKIITLIFEGLSAQEIVAKIGCNRQLVDYYFKQLKS